MGDGEDSQPLPPPKSETRKRVILLTLLLVLIGILAIRRATVRAPQVATFVVRSVAERALPGLVSDLLIRSVSPGSLTLGPVRLCAPVANMSGCLTASDGVIDFHWALPRALASPSSVLSIDHVILSNVTLTFEKETYSAPSRNSAVTFPSLPSVFAGLPRVELQRHEQLGPEGPPLPPADGTTKHLGPLFLEGTFEPLSEGKPAALEIGIVDTHGNRWQLSAESGAAHPLLATLRAAEATLLTLDVRSADWSEGSVKLDPVRRIRMKDLGLTHPFPPEGFASTLRWSHGERAINAELLSSAPVLRISSLPLLGSELKQFESSIRLELPRTLLEADHSGAPIIRPSEIGWIDEDGRAHRFSLEGTLTHDPAPSVTPSANIAAILHVTHLPTGVAGDLTAKCDEVCTTGTVRATVEPQTFPTDLSLLPGFESIPLSVTSGAAQFRADLPWGSELPPDMRLKLTALGARFHDAEIEEINGELDLTPRSAKALAAHKEDSRLTFRRVSFGAEVEGGGLRVGVRKRENDPANKIELVVTDGTASLLSGRVKLTEGVFSPVGSQLILSFERVALADLLALHKQEYIEADGTLSGEITALGTPTRDGVRKSTEYSAKGTFRADGPGTIQTHTGGDGGKGAGALDIARRALSHYEFTSLEGAVEFLPNGTLRAETHLHGKSPALESNRPVDVNFTVEENMHELFKSLHIAQEIEREVGNLF